jgi:hypothetical protein
MSAGITDYWGMVREWEAIFARSLSDEGAQAACLAVLQSYVGQKALSHARHKNPRLRFYAEMLLLRTCLRPTFANDDFGKVVIWPMYRLVDDWVRANTEPAAIDAGSAAMEPEHLWIEWYATLLGAPLWAAVLPQQSRYCEGWGLASRPY